MSSCDTILKQLLSTHILNTHTHTTNLQPLYSIHYIGQPVLPWQPYLRTGALLLDQSFTAHIPLLTATGTFGLRRRVLLSGTIYITSMLIQSREYMSVLR